MKKYILLLLIFFNRHLVAQDAAMLTIEECYAMATTNYPLTKQRALIQESSEYTVNNISKGYLPQVSFAGQATYQSEVTQIPIKLPGNPIERLSKDQYKIYGEVNQVLYDGGAISNTKKIQELGGKVEEQKLEVELYKLKDRINQL
ncbi:MAG TPA: TolC family protein, partial [Cytophagaceae bacterium]